VKTRAVRDGDEWVITGQKMFTTGAQFCQYCFLLTRTDMDAAKHKGLTVFVLPLNLPGIEITPIDTLGGERTNFVYLDEVRVSDGYRLGPVNDGWTVVSAPLAAEHGMDGEDDASAGSRYAYTTKVLLEAVTAWASEQTDAGGRRLIEDPSVRRRLAQVAMNIEATELSPGPMGRILAADLMIEDASALLEILGPAGQLPKGADGALVDGLGESSFRFAPGTAIYGGSTDIHRNLIAQHYLGLPRSTPKG
jgi:alkylation response protein AidB-like acyl-CoA dehydrogenase